MHVISHTLSPLDRLDADPVSILSEDAAKLCNSIIARPDARG